MLHLSDFLCVVGVLHLQLIVVLDESLQLRLKGRVLQVDLLQLLLQSRLLWDASLSTLGRLLCELRGRQLPGELEW